MKNKDYREVFEYVDVATAFFSVALEDHSQKIKDVIVEDCNQRYLDLAEENGNRRDQVIHHSYFSLLPDHDPRWNSYFYRAAILRQHVNGELRNQERKYWIEFSGGPSVEKQTCWMAFINHRFYKNENERLVTLSLMDQLTNVKNRNAYQEILTRLKKQQVPVGTIIIDINGLKEINDTHGHEAGDKLIKKAADFLCLLSGDDLPYRIGGDEFILLLINKTYQETEKTLNQIQTCRDVSFSSGAYWTNNSALIEDTLNQADKEMYEVKKVYYRTHERRHVR